jgi:predicted metal-binding membrane protein
MRCGITSVGDVGREVVMNDHTAVPATATGSKTVSAVAALAVTIGIAVGCWIVSLSEMNGMSMDLATRLGSFALFAALWVPMMAAMMLPGAGLSVARQARARSGLLAVAGFLVSYVAVWALVGVVVYALYRPHGSVTAGALAIAAGLYELTPLKRSCRQQCQQSGRSGLQFGLYCVGSSIGLMLVLLAVGLMSVTWMAVITAVVLVQKLLPARALIDLPVAAALVGFGFLIIIAPSSIRGLMPPM